MSTNISILKSEIQELLIDGPKSMSNQEKLSNSNSNNIIPKIHEACMLYKIEVNKIQKDKSSFKNNLEKYLIRAKTLKESLELSGIFEKHRDYLQKQLEVDLLLAAKSLDKLRNYKNIQEIPKLITDLLKAVPKNLPSGTHLAKKLMNDIDIIKNKLIENFHSHFEESAKKSTITDPKLMWESIRETSETKLLSIFMVSLLPISFGATVMATELYQNTLDSALTPLWGRFHFHLSLAREENTINLQQLEWTFRYSQSFLEMLVGLCSHVSGSSFLQNIAIADYDRAARAYVCEKATKFMRAHVACVIEHEAFPISWMNNDGSSSRNGSNYNENIDIVLGLVEGALQFDSNVRSICVVKDTANVEFVSDVLYDARIVRSIWFAAEEEYFTEAVKRYCEDKGKDRDSMKEKDFEYTISLGEEPFTLRYRPDTTANVNESRSNPCFNIVFNLIFLTNLAAQRYYCLSARVQKALASLIVEPLMTAVPSVLLYRLRTDNNLIEVSRSTSTAGSISDFGFGRRRHISKEAHEAADTIFASLDHSVRSFTSLIEDNSNDNDSHTSNICLRVAKKEHAEALWKLARQVIAEAKSNNNFPDLYNIIFPLFQLGKQHCIDLQNSRVGYTSVAQDRKDLQETVLYLQENAVALKNALRQMFLE